MITVSIAINGQPIYTRSAVNRLKEVGKYVQDDGQLIEHDPKDGAVRLAIKMLDTINDDPDDIVQTLLITKLDHYLATSRWLRNDI